MKSIFSGKLRQQLKVRPWVLGILGLVVCAGSASAYIGGGPIPTSPYGYLGAVPDEWFEDDACPTPPITYNEDFFVREYLIDAAGVRDDGDDNTYLRCQVHANPQQLFCLAGLPDGSVVSCNDRVAAQVLPQANDSVWFVFDGIRDDICQLYVESTFGTADPKCRGSGSGGPGTGNNTGSSSCNASTADVVLSTNQVAAVASDSCIQLKNESSWAVVNPLIQAGSAGSQYPVPFTYSSCVGSGSGQISGDWATSNLTEAFDQGSNPACDIFLDLKGTGSQVDFTYYQ